ncbi:hypothetical protein HOP50_13g70500 [Chloropicon primus]|uniref:Uncharacterized protein n=1 Tax=Chloropicon primus TaxID=1764295 RepID=A0A5B8MVY2_9CHLO|nr:hypothetical protein A3770_13p70290 [Chloropicon primus]UPR03720.1 hypothetical protein HOP50_13g70500 [Chloropicon primus]|eukprot:QDZ24511.1 hypothetical protein A3770_13p70290 [Chloropicon primus]
MAPISRPGRGRGSLNAVLVVVVSGFFLLLLGAVAACPSGYGDPVAIGYTGGGGWVEEESGIAASRLNPGVLWLHNDNYDSKFVYAVSTRTGHVVSVLDLEGLPGVNQYSDFEDLALAPCPFQASIAEDRKEHCIWVGEVGNNAEWGKGAFVYVIPEPLLGEIHDEMGPVTPRRPEQAVTFRLDFEHYEYFKSPNVEAMAVAGDGSRFWLFRKTTSHDGDGPAEIWESPSLLEGESFPRDACEVDSNSTWICSLSDREFEWTMTSHPHGAAELGPWRKPSLSIRSSPGDQSAKVGTVIPLRLSSLGKMTNPELEGVPKESQKDRRNIAAADLSLDGKRLLLGTYGGIFEYDLGSPYDMASVLGSRAKQLTRVNRDGSSMLSIGGGDFWAGQEGVCYDASGGGIWSVSEHHKKLYFLPCL